VWTMERAERAGLAGKDVWKKYGEAMCKARAISEVCREGAEDALMGVHYTPEELSVEVTEGGEAIAVPEAAAEPSEDWPKRICDRESLEELAGVGARIRDLDGWTDSLKAAWLARAGVLSRAEALADDPADDAPVDGELVEESKTVA